MGPDAPGGAADRDRGLGMGAQVVVPGGMLALAPVVVSMTTGSPDTQLEKVCRPRVRR